MRKSASLNVRLMTHYFRKTFIGMHIKLTESYCKICIYIQFIVIQLDKFNQCCNKIIFIEKHFVHSIIVHIFASLNERLLTHYFRAI